MSIPTSYILLYGFKEIFFSLPELSPLVSASCCAASHMAMMILSDHTAARLFHDADRLLLERRKLFSCKGRREVPTRSRHI